MKPGLTSYSNALVILSQQSQPLRTETIPLTKARGRFLGEGFKAPFPLPRFANAGLDGFALIASHTYQASAENPVSIPVAGTIVAGQANLISKPPATHQAFGINTGASLPPGYDTVLPIEEAIYSPTPSPHLKINAPLKALQNIRSIGDDVKTGDFLLAKSRQLHAAELAILAAFGLEKIKALITPTLHFLATGDELLSSSNQAMADGKIYNTSLPMIAALCAELSLPFKTYPPLADRAELWQQHIEKISSRKKPCLIITTGAVSKGTYDLMPTTIKQLGGNILFHGVAIRPGKPILFAELPNGHYFFGLPGNPISTVIGFRFFIVPFLRHLLGVAPERPMTAILANEYKKNNRLKQFLKAYAIVNDQGQFTAEILAGQESFKIQPLLKTNGWIVADEQDSVLPVRTKKHFYPWLPLFS